MSSTSGAAAMTREQRYAPWRALAELLQREPWPHRCTPRCSGGGSGGGSWDGGGGRLASMPATADHCADS